MLRDKPLREGSRFATTFGVLKVVWTLGDVIRKLREERGWTQAELGERAGGLHQSAVVRLERASEKSERSTIERVARALEVSAADLFAFAEEASLNAELSDAQRRSVQLFQRRLIEKGQLPATSQSDPARRADPLVPKREFAAPAQKRRRK